MPEPAHPPRAFPPSPAGPLAGLKVIDLSHVMAGPTCALMLADMGADVIKVEKYPGGDDTRRMIPPNIAGESAAFMMMNRNKRGIALDLKHPSAKAVLHRLLADADILIENYRHDTIEKLGFGYSEIHARYPRLIYCSLSGFGRTGPYADRGGYDLIAQGMSGLMSITGEGPNAEGVGRPPVKVGAPVTDITAGVLAAMGVLAALHHRSATGLGQLVDTSLFEAGIMHTYWQSAICFATGTPPGPMGSAHPLNGPYQAFPTADGWINVGAANQRNWERMLAVIVAPHLNTDPRFANNQSRMANLAALEEILNGIFRGKKSTDWLAALEEAGVPAGPVLTVAQMHADPQALARDMIVQTDHPTAGKVKTIGLPVKFSATPGGIRTPAPLFGQHTRDILAAHGFLADEITTMIGEGAIYAPG